jgi:hypothetical protein
MTQYTFQFIETPFDDEMSMYNCDINIARKTLIEQLSTFIDDQLRDEMHDCNDCDMTIKIRLRHREQHVDSIRVIDSIEYEQLNDDVDESREIMLCAIECVQS